ncbi:7TM receptor with intracellular HD hydrolase [Phycisphaerae bacterium RAS1]|nr:7TM receptor with intracellular HD hydrolase [Phycisphaerae bacterium RAS1]
MWPFDRSNVRRKEIRRSKAERGLAWYQWRPTRLPLAPALTTLLVAVLASLILNTGNDPSPYHAGQYLSRAVPSRVNFRVLDEEQTRAVRIRAQDNTPNYYQLDDALRTDLQGRLTSALRVVRESADNPERMRDAATQLKLQLDDEAVAELRRMSVEDEAAAFTRAVEAAVQELVSRPLVETTEATQRRTALTAMLCGGSGGECRAVDVAALLYANDASDVEQVAEAAARKFPPPLQASMRSSILGMLRDGAGAGGKPLYRYDGVRSLEAAQRAERSVEPQFVTYGRDALIADPGPITPDESRLLRAEQEQFVAAMSASPEGRSVQTLIALARSLIVFIVIVGLAAYLWRYQRRLLLNPMQYTLTPALLLALLGAGRGLYLVWGNGHFAVGVQALAAALVAILYSRGAMIGVCGALAALLTLATREGLGFFLMMLAVGATMLFQLRGVRNRGTIVLVGVVAAGVALVTTIATGLIEGESLLFSVRHHAMWAAITTLAAAFVVEGILPGIERVFGISTGMTLLEWCDANKPLLRMLAAEAPGTYNHSLMVGTMAEAACEAIGANGLLARAGAYYHDIGKVNKPEYFIENQDPGDSRHERLSPAMSHLIIVNHVKDGIEMAREYGVPAALHAFIVEHHGTTLVEFFYHAASKQRRPEDPEVPDTSFRYPGPKPQSRETAVLMICDAVEGMVRAMPEPTPGRIEDTVSRLVQKRLLDGQFDECDLTFRDLQTIENSIIKSLNSIYHARIKYPEPDDEKAEPATAPPKAS